MTPAAFLELHIEQGPIMDAEGYDIGAVDNLQGIHWQKVHIEGVANHAGTTPTRMRVDAGLAAAKVNVFCREMVEKSGGVATVGTIAFKPDAVNVIPSQADFTVDLRNPDKAKLDHDEELLADYLKELEKSDNVKITTQRMTCFDPVPFDESICLKVEAAAGRRDLKVRRMVSGAGQDAQMMARICPTAMIFVPSVKGISHNPKEYTPDEAAVNGANVFLDVVCELADA
ncbi:MAG: hydantoinase/carbamoylase family amidase [Lachnospiraceae bacterium]|nr:hydantoinase/carbamoylase family amidase [Lachnospiraceae bacterium]